MANNYTAPVFSTGTTTYKDLDISFEKNPWTGDLLTVTDGDDIKQSLYNLFFITPGEVSMMPTLGSGMREKLFQPIDALTGQELAQEVAEIVNNWEPRIAILDLKISANPDGNSVAISMSYKVQNIQNPQQFTVIVDRLR